MLAFPRPTPSPEAPGFRDSWSRRPPTMSRAETAVDSRVVREGHPMEAPGGDRSPVRPTLQIPLYCSLVSVLVVSQSAIPLSWNAAFYFSSSSMFRSPPCCTAMSDPGKFELLLNREMELSMASSHRRG